MCFICATSLQQKRYHARNDCNTLTVIAIELLSMNHALKITAHVTPGLAKPTVTQCQYLFSGAELLQHSNNCSRVYNLELPTRMIIACTRFGLSSTEHYHNPTYSLSRVLIGSLATNLISRPPLHAEYSNTCFKVPVGPIASSVSGQPPHAQRIGGPRVPNGPTAIPSKRHMLESSDMTAHLL